MTFIEISSLPPDGSSMVAANTQRGRLLLYVAVTLLILERLIFAGYAIAAFSNSQINWTSVLLPLTHIAVVIFLLVTVDMLIYWLVIMWSLIVTGIFIHKFYLMFNWDSLKFSQGLPGWWMIGILMVFHLVILVILLLPAVRVYLAQQRSKLDFVDTPEDKQ
jgi:hypothetical protein